MESVNNESRIKEFYKKNKEYLPVVIILPTLLGALVQLVQLILISPTYYKFFSITQSVIDGSYILFQLILIIVIVNFYNDSANNDEFHFFKSVINKRGNSKQKSKRLFWRLLIVNFSFNIGVAHFQDFIVDFKWPNLKVIIGYLILSLIVAIFASRKRTKFYMKSILELYKKREEPKKSITTSNIKSSYIIGITVLLLINLVLTNRLPKVDFNKTYIVNKITNDYKLEEARILFYNDTYIVMNLQNKECVWEKGVFKTEDYFFPSN